MPDPPLYLGFEEAPTPFAGPPQRARIWTEHWVRARLFCPNCGAANVSQFTGNRPPADFFYPACREEYELKSQESRLCARATDRAFPTICDPLIAANAPSPTLLNYDPLRRSP